MGNHNGRFVWYELMTRDPEAAKSFYGDVVGWETAPFESSEMEYEMWKAGDSYVGGVMKMTSPQFDNVPSHWLAYIATDDVDAAAEKVKELGGQVYHGPADIPEVGRFAVVADSHGGVFSLFKGMGEQEGEPTPPTDGHVGWHELASKGLDDSWKFYNTLFGWEIDTDMDMGGGNMYRLFRPQGIQWPVGGMYTKDGSAGEGGEQPVGWTLYFRVPNLEASLEKVKAKGGTLIVGPMEVPGEDRIAVCMDPEGTMFALVSGKAAQ